MLTGWGRKLVTEGEIPPGVDTVMSKPPKLLELRAVLANHFSKGVAPGRVERSLTLLAPRRARHSERRRQRSDHSLDACPAS